MKRKLLFAIAALLCSIGSWAQASYNYAYKEGTAVGAGSDFFLYNIGAKRFLDNGMNWGTRATVDNAGKSLTLTLNDGKYTINTGVKTRYGGGGAGDFLNSGGYMDGASSDWTFESVSVDGYTNVYKLKTGDNYLVYQTNAEGDNPACNVTSLSGSNNDYWILITKAQRQAAKDYTFMLDNTCFNRPWEYKAWTCTVNSTGTSGNATPNQSDGNPDNRCAESYRNDFTYLQNATGTISEGRYKLYNQGFYRKDGGSGVAQISLNSTTADMKVLNGSGEGTTENMGGASTAFSAGQYVNSVEAFVNTGSLEVGVKNTNNMNWVIWSNFYLEYLGQCVMDYAVALPDGGAMTADTWYYFDIAVAGDNYNATATTLGDIVCTDDGYALTSNTGNVTLSATDNTLAARRYYVKSSSANNLAVSVASYSYIVGDPTVSIADGSYVKSLTTVTYTFDDEASNDPEATFAILDGSATASLKKDGVEVKTGALSLSGNVLTATFSDVTLVYNANDYSIVLPADVVGFEDQESNSEVSISFNTPLFADGDYYLKNKDNGAYFAGGLGWGTQAITNSIGHVVTLTALSNGKYTIDTHLSNGGDNHFLNGLWCDGSSSEWTFAASGEYYTINNGTNNLTAGTVGTVLTLAAGTGNDAQWSLLSKSAWKTEQVARLDAADIKTGVDATFYLPAAKFNRNDTENTSWLGDPGIDGLATGDATCNFNGQKYNTTPFDVYQVLTDLEPGVYKVTMQGFYRNGTTDDRNAILYANGYKVPLVNIRSAGVTTQDDDKGFTTANGDYYVPNKQDEAAKAFNNDYYQNELYFEVAADGELRIGVKKDEGATGDWAVFDNFQLTYYGPGVTGTIASSGYSTFSTDQALDFTKATGITAAYVVSNITNTYVSLTKVDELPANSGMILKGTGGDTFIIPSVVSASAPATNKLHAAVTATDINANEAYILKSGEFCLVTEDSKVPAGKAYLLAEDVPAEAKALSFTFDDEATAIRSIEGSQVTVDSKDIYNVAGQRMSRVQKGVNIVNGKKILVK